MLKIGDFVEVVERPAQSADAPWHLAMTRGGREIAVKEFLNRHGFEVYFPLTRVMRPVSRKQMSHKQRAAGAVVRRAVLRPVFPSYVFVQFDPDRDRWHGFFDAAGVHGLVCAGDLPVPIDGELIEHMRSQEVDGAIPGTILWRRLFEVGETVRIAQGPFAGFHAVIEQLPPSLARQVSEGRIEDIDESERVSLAIDIFGRAATMKMAIGMVEKQ
ncbi:Transcription antitermination protein RfaH [Afipia felis]